MIKTSMLAAVYAGPYELSVQRQPVRLPESGEILVRVNACGLCGTDIHIYQGEKGAANCPPGTILGHEFSGMVTAIGANVQGIHVGDRVAVDPNDQCGACLACRNGQGHFCQNMTGIGTTTHGGFAEFCTMRAKQAWLLPDHLPLAAAAFAEPIACCLHGLDRAALQSGQTVLIFGGGTIGLIMLQLCLLQGAARVVVVEPQPEKRRVAEALGAHACLDPAKLSRAALQDVSVFAPDLTIECAGRPETVRHSIEYAGRGGKVLLFGLTASDDVVPIRPFDLFERELTLLGSFINPYTMGRALQLLENGRLQTDPLVCQQIALTDIKRAFADPTLRAAGKVLIMP